MAENDAEKNVCQGKEIIEVDTEPYRDGFYVGTLPESSHPKKSGSCEE